MNKNLSKFSSRSKGNLDLVFNWHLLQPCNYGCQYCFAKWKNPDGPEVHQRKIHIVRLLKQLASLIPEIDDRVRLNIAGGEPMILYKKGTLGFIIKKAHRLGMVVSMISNGSLIRDDFMDECGEYLETIGISVDSLNYETNASIGRISKSGDALSRDDMEALIGKLRTHNPNIKIKINIVVNSKNYEEDMSEFLECIKPDRIKILKMLPVTTSNLKINDDQFQKFCSLHQSWIDRGIAVTEDNEDMVNGYLMIDPWGRFFQNKPEEGSGYDYSASIVDVGVRSALDEVEFNLDKYKKRYR